MGQIERLVRDAMDVKLGHTTNLQILKHNITRNHVAQANTHTLRHMNNV